jgi:hypothetical protein
MTIPFWSIAALAAAAMVLIARCTCLDVNRLKAAEALATKILPSGGVQRSVAEGTLQATVLSLSLQNSSTVVLE